MRESVRRNPRLRPVRKNTVREGIVEEGGKVLDMSIKPKDKVRNAYY